MSKKEMTGWIKSIIIALGITFVVRTFLFSPYIVKGDSMKPTLHDEEKMFVNKLVDFSRGDIVIIRGPKENYVKRVIGFPGDKIKMKNDQLWINNRIFKEPYLSDNLKLAQQHGSRLTEDFGPIIVPKHHYFVMGDNRLYSRDSRNELGYINEDSIIGKSEFVFYPLTDIRVVK